MKYPALDVDGLDSDYLLALVDEFDPTAVQSRDSLLTIFFADAGGRDRALDAIVRAHPATPVTPRDVDDEDWARRSQQNLTSVTVGRVTVAPPWTSVSDPQAPTSNLQPPTSGPQPQITITIAPSMGFGTGHHATTRLCLRALQELDVNGASVLDVGTGSGILAIAARALGAADVVGIDDDRDAIQSAEENLAANPGVNHVRFETIDLRSAPLPAADIVTANLTGALLMRSAGLLLGALKPGGMLVVSGVQRHERDEVAQAFERARLMSEATEDEWVAMIFRR